MMLFDLAFIFIGIGLLYAGLVAVRLILWPFEKLAEYMERLRHDLP